MGWKQNMTLHEGKFGFMSYRLNPIDNSSDTITYTAADLRELWELPSTYVTPGGAVVLTPSPIVKDLGIYLSADGTWHVHINQITRSATTVANWVIQRSIAGFFRIFCKPPKNQEVVGVTT